MFFPKNFHLIAANFLFIIFFRFSAYAQVVVHHDLKIELNPQTHFILGQDLVLVPMGIQQLEFILDKSILPSIPKDSGILEKSDTSSEPELQTWKLSQLKSPKIVISFQGTVNHPVLNDDSPGHIGAEGISLFPSSGWYPHFLNFFETFNLEIGNIPNWTILSQGQLIRQNSSSVYYSESKPQEGIYLFGGAFTKYSKVSSNIEFNIYLKTANEGLAQQLLSSLVLANEHYQTTIAPYPYSQFNVVENFWETGYGIPGITLLGPQVIQLPFLATSSLPHELLHNWWGNSVYVDLQYGNWCEGLTTYGADYWQQELQKTDSIYRRNELIQYKNFVTTDVDFPLVEFKSRHNSSSQAIGYGKSMMFFHMLKKLIGESNFISSLANFYKTYQFQAATWFDMKSSFEKSSGKDLTYFFKQWLTNAGSPKLSLLDVSFKNNFLNFTLNQKNIQNVNYVMEIPILIKYATYSETKNVTLSQFSQTFSLKLSTNPTSISIDPKFDLFRNIYDEEVPVTFSAFMGQEKFSYYSTDLKMNSIIDVITQKFNTTASELSSFSSSKLPTEDSILLIGFNVEIKNVLTLALFDQGIQFNDDSVLIDSQKLLLFENTFAMSFKFKNKTFYWFLNNNGDDPNRSAQRLTHYTNQSLVVFKKDKSLVKKTWEPKTSPLTFYF